MRTERVRIWRPEKHRRDKKPGDGSIQAYKPHEIATERISLSLPSLQLAEFSMAHRASSPSLALPLALSALSRAVKGLEGGGDVQSVPTHWRGVYKVKTRDEGKRERVVSLALSCQGPSQLTLPVR
jgi:hypothetical protein